MIKNRLGREILHITEILTAEEQEMYKSNARLFQTLSEKFKLHHIKTILFLQYCKFLKDNKK